MFDPASASLDPAKSIAIVGLQLRYPGATTLAEFWQNLRNGVESITFFTDDELKTAGFAPETLGNPSFVKSNPHIGDISQFDPAFFGFTPREAEAIDPQIRVMLECAWQALENAGYDPERVDGRVGVCVRDTGCGIPDDQLPRVFDPFFTTRADATDPAQRGSGLGLSVSLGIVESHGGEMTVESRIEQGSSFRVLLPLSPLPLGEA